MRTSTCISIWRSAATPMTARSRSKGRSRSPATDPIDHEVDTVYHVIVKYGDSYDDGADNLLVIPYSNSSLNVAYILYDTILLTIPLRHVHPLGKCNRAMADALRKHKRCDDEETDRELDDIDSGMDDGED